MTALWMLLTMSEAQAGPWVKEPGHAYVKAGYVLFSSDNYVDPNGFTVDGIAYTGQTAHLYAEVGVAPHLQVVANLPFVGARNTIDGVAYINRQLGDAELGLATGTKIADKVPVSLTATAKLPLYDNEELRAYGLSAERFPAMGDGQVDVTATAAIGTGIRVGPLSGWTAAEVGYRHRTEWWMGDSAAPAQQYVDGIPWHLQLGWSPRIGDRDLGWLTVDGTGIQNLSEDAVTKQFGQLGASLGAKLWKGLALEAGYTQMVWARASSLGSSVSGGLSASW